MLEWLAVWGVTTAAKFVFLPILEDLVKEGAKDWRKDLFKNTLSKIIRLPSRDALNIAAGKALKEFLELIQQELQAADLKKQEIRQYLTSLQQFIKDQSVKDI